MQILKNGSRGEEVRKLQQLLNNKGFNLKDDGSFGEKTEKAVRTWQTNLSLKVDGKVGEDTWKSLGVSNPQTNTLIPSNITFFSLKEYGETELTPNFKVREFACKDRSDAVLIDVEFIKNYLQKIREYFGKPITITSGYRTPEYNENVGGSSNSYHCKGQAFDISIAGVNNLDIVKYAESLGIKGIILYPGKTFVHIDSRTEKYYSKDGAKTSTLSFRA